MKLKLIMPFVLLFSLLVSSATPYASEKQSTVSASAEEVYTENTLNITVSPDHPRFTIKLKSNPTTGYSWFLREYDAKLISPVSHRFQHSDTKLMGAPGFELWTFNVSKVAFVVPHQTRIRFVYIRPWQTADTVTQLVFRVTTTQLSP